MRYYNNRMDCTTQYSQLNLSQEILDCLQKSERKMRYMERDLKTERPLKTIGDINPKSFPAREDSYERLQENTIEFICSEPTPGQALEKKSCYEALHKSLDDLSDEEFEIIRQLYFTNRTMRAVAKAMGVSHVTIYKRHQRILDKLRKNINILEHG